MALKKIGVVGVDAGLVIIGDPGYLIHTEPENTLGKDWEEFCDLLAEEEGPTIKQFTFPLGNPGLAVVVSSGFGDGMYPVYAEVVDTKEGGKRVKRLTIEFF
jgi:hypothetical protein